MGDIFWKARFEPTTGMLQVRVAAIGCGYWGKNLVRNFAELGALAAICDPDRAAASELADRYHARVAEFTVGCGCDPGEAPSRLRSEG